MSTANFITQKDFPLFLLDDSYTKFCPDCYLGNAEDADECEGCGRDLKDVEPIFDDSLEGWIMQDCQNVSEGLKFFRITVRSGYYCGVQLFVEENEDNPDPHDMDNADTHIYYDCCRSKAIRAYDREKARIPRLMRKIAEQNCMEEYYCAAVFSNGEAFYERVPDKTASMEEHARYAARRVS